MRNLFLFFGIVFFLSLNLVYSQNISLENSTEVNISINESLNLDSNLNSLNITENQTTLIEINNSLDNRNNSIDEEVFYRTFRNIENKYEKNNTQNYTIQVEIPQEEVLFDAPNSQIETNEKEVVKALINFEDIPVKSIEFPDLEIVNNTIELGIEELENDSYVQSFAIDPEKLNFTNATVSVVAKGNHLYKCAEWNFSSQECEGNVTLYRDDLVPGQEYTFPLYPKDPAFFEAQVNNIDNDARARNNVLQLTNAIRIGNNNGNVFDAYFRFTDVNIPFNSTIHNATLNLTSDRTESGTVLNTNIFGLLENNCSNFNTASGGDDPTDNTRTINFVAWDSISAWTNNENSLNTISPNISIVVQELVSQVLWQANNSICIVIEDDGSSDSAFRQIQTIAETGAFLQVNYSEPPPDLWWNRSFSGRYNLNFTNTGSTNLTDFPIYYYLTKEVDMQSDYDDVRFIQGVCDSLDPIELDYELETSNSTNAAFWIKLNNFTIGDNSLCVYFGNSTVSTTANPSNVWTSNFDAVWHLAEGGTGTRFDSTLNSNDATTVNYDGDEATTGIIGGADLFDGTNDYLAISNLNYASSSAISQISVCSLVRSSSSNQQIISSFDRNEYWRLSLKDDSASQNIAWDTTEASSAIDDFDSISDYSDGEWHYICGWYNASAIGNNKKIFVDGEEENAKVAHSGASLGRGNTRFGFIGVGSEAPTFNGATGPALFFNGEIEEVRISSIARSNDWINQSFQFMINQAQFTSRDAVPEFSEFSIERLNPLTNSSIVTQNQTITMSFNVSCSDVGDGCGDFNLTLFRNSSIDIGEASSVSLANFESKLIEFDKSYSSTPVVIATLASNNNADENSLIPFFYEINETHMNISLCKDSGATTCESSASAEDVHYIVFDRDVVNQQSWIETGVVSGSTNGGNTALNFNNTFSTAPLVFSTVQSHNSIGSAIKPTVWTHSITTTNAQLIACDHPGTGDACAGSTTENIGYVAIDVSSEDFSKFNSGTESISNSAFTAISYGQTYSNPRMMVLQTSDNGAQDPEYPWARLVTSTGADIRFCEQDGAGDCDSHTAEDVSWAVLEDGLISLSQVEFVEVSTLTGFEPLFTSSSNPQSGNLNVSENVTIDFVVNMTGELRTNHSFFTRLQTGLQSETFNVYIQGPSQVVWNTTDVNFSDIFVDELTNPLILRISSTNANTGIDINCLSGNCSEITTNFTSPISLNDLEFEEIYFSCDNSLKENYTAIFNVSSDQFLGGNLVEIGCSVGEKLLDVDLIDPAELSRVDVIQNRTINVSFNISCNDATPCGDINVSAVFRAREVIGEAGSVSLESFESKLIKFDNAYSSTPILVAIPASNNNADENSLTLVTHSINRTHMNVSLCKDSGATTCDISALAEDVHYYLFDVDKANTYSWLEVGKVDINTNGVGNTVNFNKTFSSTPFIFALPQTYNNGPNAIGAHAWTPSVTTSSMSLIGCDHPGTGDVCAGSSTETFAYVAIDVASSEIIKLDSGSESIADSIFSSVSFSETYSNPRIMVLANTEVGGQDPAYPWARNVVSSGAEIRYCEQDASGVCNSHSAETTVWMVLEDGNIEINESGFLPISTTIGASPVFTTDSNPQQITLFGNSNQIVNFTINVSGPVDTSYEIFGSLSNGDSSLAFVLDIIGNPKVEWEVNSRNFSLGFTNEIPTETVVDFFSTYSNTNVNVSCESGDCSTITSNWTLPISTIDNQEVSILFTCSNLAKGNFSALFNLSSDEFIQGDILNLSCSIDEKLIDIDLLDPSPFSSLEVLQNSTIKLEFNVSCNVGASCGDLNITLAYKNNSAIGEVGKASFLSGDSSVLIELNRTYKVPPVVLLTTATDNDDDNNSLIPYINSVNRTHFDFSLCKDSGNPTCDTSSSNQVISYFVFDEELANQESWIEVGRAELLTNGLGNTINFNKTFLSTPFVFAWAQSDNDGANAIAPTIWANSVTTTSTSLIACDHPSGAGASENVCSGSTTEEFAYIAIDVNNHNLTNISSGSESIANSEYVSVSFGRTYENAAVLVLVNTEVGAEDPVYPHAKDITSTGARIRYCEQDGNGVCNSHSAESTVWMAFEVGDMAQNGSGFSIISNSFGRPFFTNASSDPVSITLNSGESQEITYYLNNTGDFNFEFEIFAFINDFDDTSESFFTKIIQPLDLFQIYFGFLKRDVYLGLAQIVFFNFTNDSSTNLFVVDSDSDIDWSNLSAFGRRVDGSASSNDFLEFDSLFNHSELYKETIQSEFASDASNGKFLRDLEISGLVISNIPFTNSTSSNTFQTGILWDSSDDSGNGEFDLVDNEDIIFVAPTNLSQLGSFGISDYEIKVPETLRSHKGANSELEFVLDFK